MKRMLIVVATCLLNIYSATTWAFPENDSNIVENKLDIMDVKVSGVVREYISAWKHKDARRLNELLTNEGGYSDYNPDNNKVPLRDTALQNYVGQFRYVEFMVTGVNVPEDNKVTIFWKARWPADDRLISFHDDLVLSSDHKKISHIDSVSAPAPADIVDLVNRFALGWVHLNGQEVLDTFTPDGIYYDAQYPQGIFGTELVNYVESLTFLQGGLQTNICLAKDRKAHGNWELRWRATGDVVVRGMDVFTLRDDKILKVQGYNF